MAGALDHEPQPFGSQLLPKLEPAVSPLRGPPMLHCTHQQEGAIQLLLIDALNTTRTPRRDTPVQGRACANATIVKHTLDSCRAAEGVSKHADASQIQRTAEPMRQRRSACVGIGAGGKPGELVEDEADVAQPKRNDALGF